MTAPGSWTDQNVTVHQIAKTIDHSLLRPELTIDEVVAGCAVAAEYDVASVCARPLDVSRCVAELAGTDVLVGTVIGFPHGSNATATKVFEAELAMRDGAVELDMVLPIGYLRSGELDYVRDDIAAVAAVAHAGGAIVKVILENAYLTDPDKVAGCQACEAAGADYVKTSTGFAPGGATLADLALMRATVSPSVKVKAAGGIRTLDALIDALNVGIDRSGATATAAIIDDLRARQGQGMIRTLGVDLGGTNIKGLVLELPESGDPAGVREIGRAAIPTRASDGPVPVIDRIADLGRQLVAEHGPVDFAGLGVPGLFDSDEGSIVLLPNLPGDWPGQPLTARMDREWGVPTAMINDARAFTLAETRMGAAAGLSTVVCITLGTGIGGGVVIDGRLRAGPHGRAGELGHQVILAGGPECGCGGRGCVESVARAEVLARAAGVGNARQAYDAARAGDPRAVAAVEAVADHLGQGLGNLVTVLVPQRIVVGGGIANAGEVLLTPLRAAIARHSVLVPVAWYDVVPARLGSWSGAVGAAIWGRESGMAA